MLLLLFKLLPVFPNYICLFIGSEILKVIYYFFVFVYHHTKPMMRPRTKAD